MHSLIVVRILLSIECHSIFSLKKNKNDCKGSPSYGVSKGQAAEAVRFAEP